MDIETCRNVKDMSVNFWSRSVISKAALRGQVDLELKVIRVSVNSDVIHHFNWFMGGLWNLTQKSKKGFTNSKINFPNIWP